MGEGCFHGYLLCPYAKALVILIEAKRRFNSAGCQQSTPEAFARLELHTSPCAIIDCNDIIAIMASITIRNLKESTKRKLKIQAALNGRSMEQEAREVLDSALRSAPAKQGNLAEHIRSIWEPLGGVELEPLPREPMRDPDWLKDWK